MLSQVPRFFLLAGHAAPTWPGLLRPRALSADTLAAWVGCSRRRPQTPPPPEEFKGCRGEMDSLNISLTPTPPPPCHGTVRVVLETVYRTCPLPKLRWVQGSGFKGSRVQGFRVSGLGLGVWGFLV